jgi:tRNA threonylcarbamoyladenosine biosynthesis protein TsaB
LYILNIETATKNCSVALAKNGETILCKEISELGYSHAEKLHVFIEEICKESSIQLKDLHAIAVSKGPGSYTGLRIGVSAAKGLCFALDIPLISVDTLAVLASQAQLIAKENDLIIPMIDARRMEVYSAIFNNKLEKIREIEAQIIDENLFTSIENTVYFVGDSSEKAKAVLTKSNFIFLEEIVYPSAKDMSAISIQKFLNKDFEDVAYFEPFYLKDFLITTSKK